MNTAFNTGKGPTQEQVLMEIAVAVSLMEKYGTNQPGKSYEDGVADALLWVLGGKQPQLIEDQDKPQPAIDWATAPAGCSLYYISPIGIGYWMTGWIHDLLGVAGRHPISATGIYMKPCSGCGKTGGGKCPDCGVVMGDATYTEMLACGALTRG